MSSALELFSYAGANLRTAMIDGEAWFVSADVLSILELSRSSIALLDDDERGVHSMDTPSGPQDMSVISEAGLFSLILRSRKPEAKKFKRWITHDVLPKIRQTGSYSGAVDLRNDDHVAMIIQAGYAALTQARELKARNAVLEPKAESWDVLASAEGDFSVREAAQILDRDPGIETGERRLFATLVELGWLDRRKRPYQSYINAGRLSSRPTSYEHPRTGAQVLGKPQVRVTVKGVQALHRDLGGERALQIPLGVV